MSVIHNNSKAVKGSLLSITGGSYLTSCYQMSEYKDYNPFYGRIKQHGNFYGGIVSMAPYEIMLVFHLDTVSGNYAILK